jgi:competence protein ComEC
MRRPAFQGAVCLGTGIFLADLMKFQWILWMLIAMALSLCVFALSKRIPVRPCILLFCCLLIGIFSYVAASEHGKRHESQTGKVVQIKGEVLSVSQTGERATFILATESYGKVLLNAYQKDPDFKKTVGRQLSAVGLLELPQTAGNPGGFDYRLYLKSIGVYAVMQADTEALAFSKTAVNRLSNGIAVFRADFESRLSEALGEEQTGLAAAMMFGDKSGLADEDYETYQRNGTAHILSVSGLHVGFLYGILVFLMGGKRKPVPNGIILTLLLLYGMLSGFCPAVDRALLMIGLHMLSKVLCRAYDLLSAAGLSAMAILLQNPLSLFQSGFQLSFFAVVLMGWIFPLIHKALPKGHFLGILLPIPALQLAMAPLTAYLFNTFSFGAFLANFGVVFFSGLLIPAGLLAMLSLTLPAAVFQLTATFLDLCLRCVTWCNEATYAGGRTCLDVVSPPVWILLAFYGFSFFLLSETGVILMIRKRRRAVAVALATVLLVAAFVGWRTEDGFHKADAVFVDVGQGDCLHIRTPSGKNILIDGGGKESFDVGKRILKPYLLKNGVRKVDLAVVTHLDTDHYDGIRSLATDGMVKTLGLYAGNRLLESTITKQTGLSPDRLRYLHQGDRIQVDSDVWLEFLYPAEKPRQVYETEIKAKEENPRSLVVRVHVGGYSILMTGDMDVATEEDVMSSLADGDVRADILKICHHGSKYSTSDGFLQAVDPTIAVFQVGKNNYGHPNRTILEKCREKGIMIYRNDQNGAIGFFGLYENPRPYVRTFRRQT